MRKIVFCAALVVCAARAAAVVAQAPPAGAAAGPGRIAGVVTSAEGQPLPTAGITVRAATDSALVAGALTDGQGRFRVDGLLPGRYVVRVSLLGYRPRSSEPVELTPQAPAVDLGEIVLEVSAVELDALEASAERQAVVIEADRTTYSARTMPVAASGTATDVLRAVPELEVDVNDNVTLRGNQPVAIHINGRPAPLRGEQLANFLRQLPGNRIDRVEVMPNPSAKHDPEGMGGIVNIVLRDDLNLGLSGSMTATASTRNRQYANTRINYQRGRLTLFTGMGLNRFAWESRDVDVRRNLIAHPVTVIEQQNASADRNFGWNLDWTAEYRAGRQATLWSNAWMFSVASDVAVMTTYGIFDESLRLLEDYDRSNEGDNAWGNYNVGLGFRQVFQPQKKELTIDGRVSFGVSDQRVLQHRLQRVMEGEPVDLPPELLFNDIDAGNANITVQADGFRPLGPGRIDAGYRLTRRTQDSDNLLRVHEHADAPEPLERTQSGFSYEELFHSIYTTVARPFGRFNVQAGLRAEHTRTVFDSRVVDATFEREYNSLFPSLNVAYTPKQGRTARFLYSRRINRPSTWHLDPYVPAPDPLNRSEGNPELRPSHTQSVSVDVSYTGRYGTARLAPYYRSTSGIWERIRTVDTAGVATSRWENALSSKALGSNVTLSLSPAGRLSGSTTLNMYRDARDGTNLSGAYRRSAVLWSLSGNLGVKTTEALTAQFFANHFPTQSILQGRASGYTYTSVALRQQVRRTRGSVSVTVMDPLKLMKYSSTSSDATYEQRSRSTMRSRMMAVGVTYNFGRPPEQKSRRAGGAEEEGETIRVR